MRLHNLTRNLVVIAIALGTLVWVYGGTSNSAHSVPLEQARRALEKGESIVIDIREPQEHASGVAPGAQLLPMRQLQSRLGEIPKDSQRPVLLICNTQNRSKATLNALRDKGYTNISYVEGGMSEWTRRGWPLVAPTSK